MLHYPKGNPLSSRAWPELSWATLLRHIYRRWTSWTELVNKQPEVEQHACLTLFLGIAEYLFSSKYAELVEKQKEIYKREVKKDEFASTLNQVSRELLSNQGLGVAVTFESINQAINRLDAEMGSLLSQRNERLESLRDATFQSSDLSSSTSDFEELSERWAQLESDKAEMLIQIKSIQNRLNELEDYKAKLDSELGRVERTKSAGQVFRDLRVTHCPVCEQSVSSSNHQLGHCYLCGQEIHVEPEDSSASERRIEFEIEQLYDETKEAEELIKMVTLELEEAFINQRNIEEESSYLQSRMRPIQSASAAIISPEMSQAFSEIDMNLGRIQEQKNQLERVKSALEFRNRLSEQVAQIEDEINTLEVEVTELNREINFEKASTFFSDRINDYLNFIKHRRPNSWMQDEVKLTLREKSFQFTIGNKKLSSLSATETLFFLPAYNYALLSLSNKEPYHYPGITIFDFPPDFADGSSRTDTENFILEPFIELLRQDDMQNTQVIAVGSAFSGLEDVHRIEMSRVWE